MSAVLYSVKMKEEMKGRQGTKDASPKESPAVERECCRMLAKSVQPLRDH